MSTFSWKRYHNTEEEKNYKGGSDDYANSGFAIGFHHIISNKNIYFKAFMTAFNETFNSDWSTEQVYGRADPIYTFRQTTRNIGIGFKIPAGSIGEAYENLAKVQQLTQFLYPAYADVNNSNTISQGPLVRIKFMNLLQKTPSAADPNGSYGEIFSSYAASNDATNGLLGIINDLTINHNLDADIGVLEKSQGGNAGATILPKMIDVNISFSPIHESALGWSSSDDEEDVTFASLGHPYGASLSNEQTTVEVSTTGNGEGDDTALRDSERASLNNAVSE